MVNSTSIMDIPTAILLHEIFLKLPIKAIIRCKVVCKSWFNLLVSSSNDPSSFANIYSRNSSPFTTFFLSEESRSFNLLEISKDGTNNSIRTRLEPRVPDCTDATASRLLIVDSSRGFLGLEDRKITPSSTVYTFYVSNPITGECIALPPHSVSQFIKHSSSVNFEFGFIRSTHNFKVMKLFYTSTVPYSGNRKVHVEIFTVGVDHEWRCLENTSIPPYNYYWADITYNGIYHWLEFNSDSSCWLLYTFDLGKEKDGRVIKCPPLGEKKWRKGLIMLNNHLCIVTMSSESHMTIWTMNEYGVESSWTNDVILGSWFPSDLHFKMILPFAVLPNGDTLLFDPNGNCFISCNPKTKKTANIKVYDDDVHRIPEFIKSFVPSFSSLKEIMMAGEGEDR